MQIRCDDVPSYLLSTFEMLLSAYPEGMYNDVLGVGGNDPLVDEAVLVRVSALLRKSGYDAWLAEPD